MQARREGGREGGREGRRAGVPGDRAVEGPDEYLCERDEHGRCQLAVEVDGRSHENRTLGREGGREGGGREEREEGREGKMTHDQAIWDSLRQGGRGGRGGRERGRERGKAGWKDVPEGCMRRRPGSMRS